MTDPVDQSPQDGDAIDAQFEPAPPSADHVVTPKPQRKGPGWTALIVTGVLASLVGGTVGAGMSLFGGAQGPNADPSSDLVQQQAAQIAALEDDQNKLGSSLAALKADLQKAESELATQIARATEQQATTETGSNDDALAALTARVDLLSTLPEGADGVDTGPLSARLLAFEQALADVQSGQANRADALAALSQRLVAAEAAAAQTGEGVDPDQLVSLYEDISTLKDQLADTVSSTAEREQLAALIARAEQREAASQTAQSSNQTSGKAALAMLSLEAASARGVAFPDIIPALEVANVDAGLLEDLRPIAGEGAPTLDKLQNMFHGHLVSAQAAAGEGDGADAPEEDDGWGWVRRTFGDSVKITRTEDPASDGSAALEDTANRAGDALGIGNITGAIAELEALDGAEGEAFAPWIDAANRRVKLDAALIALRASMLKQEQ